MRFLSDLKQAVIKGTKTVLRGGMKVVEYGSEVCETIFRGTKEWAREKYEQVEKWLDEKIKPKDPVHPSAKEADTPLVPETIRTIENHFPDGVIKAAEESTPYERKRMIENLVPDAAQAIGLQDPPKVILEMPETIEELDSLYGYYRKSDNTLHLNVAKIVSGEPELFREQVCTVFHELIHARQMEAISALREGNSIQEYGYSREYLLILAENWVNYISPQENAEAYTKQPIEAEAYWFEEQIKALLR